MMCSHINGEEQARRNPIRHQKAILDITSESTSIAEMWTNMQKETIETRQLNDRLCENGCIPQQMFYGSREVSGQPAMLCLQINRFGFLNNQEFKIKDEVDIPKKLEPFPGGSQYSLHSVTYHTGASVRSGHYTTKLHFKNNEEILVSDDNMVQIPSSGVTGQPYFLIYVKDELAQSPVKKKQKLVDEWELEGDFSGLPDILQKLLRKETMIVLKELPDEDLQRLHNELLDWTCFSLSNVDKASRQDLVDTVNNQMVDLLYNIWPDNEVCRNSVAKPMQLDKYAYKKSLAKCKL